MVAVALVPLIQLTSRNTKTYVSQCKSLLLLDYAIMRHKDLHIVGGLDSLPEWRLLIVLALCRNNGGLRSRMPPMPMCPRESPG